MPRGPATAKINLALVVGPHREDGGHEVTTVLQRVALADRISLTRSSALRVTGFPGDTIVRKALESLAGAAGAQPDWSVNITKRIPVASGLGGGSSDAATALRLANTTLDEPLSPENLVGLARGLGADVPFFLSSGPQLGTGKGADLERLDLPQDYWIVLILPHGEEKSSTRDVYARFDERDGSAGYAARRKAVGEALARVHRASDLAALPLNDLASSPLTEELRALGAFRADVSGAGPVVYGLFTQRRRAAEARRKLAAAGRTWLTVPAWYG